MNKAQPQSRKKPLKSFEEAKKKPDHSKEDKKSLKIGQMTKDGFTIKEILKDGRVLLTSQNGTKFVKQEDIIIA